MNVKRRIRDLGSTLDDVQAGLIELDHKTGEMFATHDRAVRAVAREASNLAREVAELRRLIERES